MQPTLPVADCFRHRGPKCLGTPVRGRCVRPTAPRAPGYWTLVPSNPLKFIVGLHQPADAHRCLTHSEQPKYQQERQGGERQHREL